MNVFEAVKQSVTTRQAAEHYGVRVGRTGMCVCPFHNQFLQAYILEDPVYDQTSVVSMYFYDFQDQELMGVLREQGKDSSLVKIVPQLPGCDRRCV